MPVASAAACIPAMSPVAMDSTYPSTPQICPANNTRGCVFHLQSLVQQRRGVDVGIAMDLSIAQEAGILKAGNQPQHAGLLAEFQMVLKADQVVGIRSQIFLP